MNKNIAVHGHIIYNFTLSENVVTSKTSVLLHKLQHLASLLNFRSLND